MFCYILLYYLNIKYGFWGIFFECQVFKKVWVFICRNNVYLNILMRILIYSIKKKKIELYCDDVNFIVL